jgi:hypothetical protein
MQMPKRKKGTKRKTSLAAFLRKLWSRPQLMERFAESRAGREEVIRQFNLTPRHAKLLLEGCVRDILVELAGAKTRVAMESTTVVNCDKGGADVECGHPECESFMATVAKDWKPRKKR